MQILLLLALFINTSCLCSHVALATAAVTVAQNRSSRLLKLHRKLVTIPLKTCYKDILPLSDSVPSFARDVTALMLTDACLNLQTSTVEHLQCSKDAKHSSSLQFIRWPRSYTDNRLRLMQLNSTAWAQTQQQSCKQGAHISGLAVAIGREFPISHFGHRMLTDLPALYALRSYLVENGVDVRHVRVIFTDSMGQPAWGPDNFKLVLHSLGFKSYEPHGHLHSMLCFDQVVFMPHYFFPKWWTDANGTRLTMWQAPEKLYDVDPFHIRMIGQIRAAAGLPARIPFAPASNRTVVLASRDREIRKKHGFRQKRILENEGELLKALQAIPGMQVLQVDFGVMPMMQTLQLLDKTSLFLGYHGAGFDNCVFLPRGASVLEILPKGTTHAPLYPALAHRTGKEFARYVNDDVSRQTCRWKPGSEIRNCLHHHADLVVDVDKVVQLVKSMLQVQAAAMTKYSFDANT